MADQIFKADFDDSEILAKLDKIEKKLTDTGNASTDAAKEMSTAFASAEKSISDFGDTLEQTNKSVSDQAKQTQAAQRVNQSWLQSIRQTIAGQQIGGKSLAEWGQQAKDFAQKIQLGAKATEGATVATRIFATALKATGIGLIIGAIGALIAYFTRFQGGIDRVSQGLAIFNGVVNTVLTRAVALGAAIGKVFSGDFTGAAEDAKAAISGIGGAILDAANAAFVLEKRIQALRDATITSSVEIARQQAHLEELKAVVDDDTQAIGKRIQVQKEAAAVETDIAKKRFDQALEQQQIEQQRFALSTKTAADKEAFAKTEIALTEAKKDLDLVVLSNEQKARELRKQAADENSKAAEKRKKELEDERKALEALDKELQKLRIAALGEGLDAELAKVNQKFDELAKEAESGIKKFNEIAAKRGLTPEELAKQKEFAELEKTIEEQRLGALLDVLTEFNEKDNAIAKEQEERKKALAEKDLERAIKSIEAEKKLRDEQINLSEQQNEKFLLELKGRGAKEEEIAKAKENLDKFIQAARLNNELEFQQNLLSLTDAGNTEQIAQIEATIATIKAKIANLQVEDPKKKPQNIFELLGITDKDAQGAIKEGVKLVIDGINQISEARVKAAEERVAAIDKEIEAEKDQLDKEIELAKAGLANNVDTEKKRLAELKAQRDAALKEEAKARRAAIILDSVQQLSSLITASANIFKSLSGLPFGLGVPVAIGVIAAMFGAFVAAKAKALKAADVPKFREGGKLPGRRHEQGGTPIIDRSGYQIAEGEEGEYLLPVGPSREHEPFLDRMRKGEFRGVNLDALIPYKSKYFNPTSDAVVRIKDIEQQRAELTDARHWASMKAAYSQGAERIVSAIEAIPEITPLHSYRRRVKRGNLTEVITVNKAE